MLHVHRAARAGDLVGALAEVLATPASDDPFVPEVVAVPSRGIERWLAQELSLRLGAGAAGRDGICAHVLFPFPATVVGWAVDATPEAPADVHGRAASADRWDPAAVTWALLEAVERPGPDGHPLHTTLGAFGAHLAGERGRARRLPALRHVADLFDRYAVHRPDMVRAWADGRDVDALGGGLPATARWQPRLWRAVHEVLGDAFAQRVAAATARLGDGDALVPGVPARLCLYGLTSLPPTYVDVLRAMAGAHDVHLFLLHPSPRLWDAVAATDARGRRPPRAADPTRVLARHPLLRSWGRDARELQLVLGEPTGGDHDHGAPTPAPGTLLARLQADVVGDTAPPGRPHDPAADDTRLALASRPTADPDHPRRAVDTSVQVHGCHGRLRQVEVLRDAVFGLMTDDPSIQPRDVVVMCPDVEAYAPLVDAVFGADAHVTALDGDAPTDDVLPDVRVRLADRSLRQVNPVLRTLSDVLHLPDGRVEVTTVLDLARRDPVRTRFGLSEGDLETVEEWVEGLGVRWGLDRDHRRRHGLDTDANTWARGLDRLLLGVAVAEDGPRTVAGVLPHDDVEGGAVDLAGRLAELVDRVGLVVEGLAEPRPVLDWCADLRRAARLLMACAPDDEWQLVQLDRLVDDLRAAAGGDDAPTVPVTLPELRSLLADRLGGRPSRANHRTGDLTVCTLVPMRSVPYRVVCLLGLDDETFPRRTVASGDDLVAAEPLVGDRDPRSEDRQLLLDALLAAEDHLVVTYRARDERTDAEVPPAVPLAELLDVIDATARPADGDGEARDLVVRHHPLRGADLRTFHPDDPFGFDPVALAGARARSRPPVPPTTFLDHLPAVAPAVTPGPTTVAWTDFVSFLDKPVKGYLRARLGLSPRDADDPVDDLLPVDLGGLDEWQVGTRLLQAAVDDDLDRWLAAERARGSVPVDALGDAAIARVRTSVDAITAFLAEEGWTERMHADADAVELDLRVGDLHLVGVVPHVHPDLLARIDYGWPKPKRVLKLWLPWLALAASGRPVEAILATRGKKPSSKHVKHPETARIAMLPGGLPVDEAMARLEPLADLWVRGHASPLPVFESTSPEFAKAWTAADRTAAVSKAVGAWVVEIPGRQPFGDKLDPATLQAFGERDLDDLLALPPEPDETGDGWWDAEPSRLGRLALRLWRPVLEDCTSKGTKR